MSTTNQPSPTIALSLMLAGAAPFVIGSVLLWIDSPVSQATVAYGLSSYAAVILSFLGGIQWGTALSINESAPRSARTVFTLSVIVPLLAWWLVFIDLDRLKLIVAVALFALAWVIDALLRLQQLIPGWFFRLRSIVSAIVTAALVMAAVRL